jgi:hypothetical protein
MTSDGDLQGLPQRFDIWEAGARQLGATVQAGGRAVQPWMTVVASSTDGQVLAFELSESAPGPAPVWDALRKAMRAPAAGKPHRPTEIRVTEQQWADDLRPHLEAVGVRCTVVAAVEEVEEVFEGLGDQLAQVQHGQPGLLDMPGVTPEAVAGFFDAAALFYEQAPWKRAGERPIQVASDRLESGPRFAVVMGQGGMAFGLVLYDTLEAVLRAQQGEMSDEESARQTSALAVVFGDEDDLPPADLEAVRKHGWRVAGPQAYPSVYRMEPGLAMRPPLVWELELLEACLRAVPEFVRKKTRRRAPLELTVPVASGDLALVLSWADE